MPSTLLALTCAAIVGSYRNAWLSAPVAELCRREGVTPSRISELKRRLLDPFQALLAQSRRRGRRPRPADPQAEVQVLEALLEVAADVLRQLPIRRRSIQERLVAAAGRLHRDHGVLQKTFCRRLGLSERTLRFWKQRATGRPAPPAEPTPPSPPQRRRSRNRGRFRLEVTLPGVQTQADTTHLRLFGVPLRLIGLQDPGERYRHLLQAARVELEESAEHVASVITAAQERPGGLQLITDQGTPYMAEEAAAGYDALDLEHCPQKEGAPTAKATIERAFGTLKSTMATIQGLSNLLAEKLPALAEPRLARSLAQLLVDALLDVYHQSRAELTHPLAGTDAAQLADLIEDQRQRAHAEWRSRRLLLDHIHRSYQMPGSVAAFIRAHRHHALEDIQEAERQLRTRACRCIARACDRYFAGILGRVAEEARHRRARQRAEREKQREKARIIAEIDAVDREHRRDPRRWLAHALDLLHGSWLPDQRQLLFGGTGAGLAAARGAIRALADQLPLTWQDELSAVWQSWKSQHRHLDQEGLTAVRDLLGDLESEIDRETHHRPSSWRPAILALRTNNPHPPHPPPLRV